MRARTTLVLLALTTAPLAGQQLTGQVVTPEGKPLVGARLELVEDTINGVGHGNRNRGAEPLVGKTDAKGRFVLSAKDMVPHVGYSLFVVSDEGEDRRFADLLRPEATRDFGKIQLRGGATVSGLVIDAQQQPVADAVVRWFPEEGWTAGLELAPSRYFGWETTTDKKGRYVLRNLPAKRGVICAAKTDYAGDARPTFATVATPWNERLVLFAEPSRYGVIRDAAGKPVKDAVVFFVPRSGRHKIPLSVSRTNAKGRYEIHVPHYPGTILSIRAPSSLASYLSGTSGGLRQDHQFEAGRELKIRVKTEDGKPVDRFAARYTRSGGMMTNFTHVKAKNGVGTMKMLGSGQIRFEVRVPGYAPGFSQTQSIGYAGLNVDRVFEVVLTKGRSLRGRFVDAAGKPFANMPIELHAGYYQQYRVGAPKRRADGNFRTGNATRIPWTTDAQGRFEIKNLAALPYVLVARHKGHVPFAVPLELTEDEDLETGESLLVRAVRVSGTFTYQGKPMADVKLQLGPAESRRDRFRLTMTYPVGTTDKSGAFVIPDVPPGRYYVLPQDTRIKTKRRPGQSPKSITVPTGQTNFAFSFNVK